jgi:CBS domain-containing protein
MRVQDVMTNRIHKIPPDVAAEDAWSVMRMHRTRHLVVTHAGRIVGILSDRDLGGPHGASVRSNHAVADLMTREVVTVSPATPIRRAANLMRGRSIGSLVVTDQGRAVGIIDVADVLGLMGRGVDRPVKSNSRWTLNHRAPHRKRHDATGVW